MGVGGGNNHNKSDQVVRQVVERGRGIASLGDTQNLTKQGPG